MTRHTVASCVAAVASVTGVSPEDILAPHPRKTRPVAAARAMVALLARQTLPTHTLPMIGRAMRRDHTTIMHAIRRASEMVETDPVFAARHAAALATIER